jgi:hypothetical protein
MKSFATAVPSAISCVREGGDECDEKEKTPVTPIDVSCKVVHTYYLLTYMASEQKRGSEKLGPGHEQCRLIFLLYQLNPKCMSCWRPN